MVPGAQLSWVVHVLIPWLVWLLLMGRWDGSYEGADSQWSTGKGLLALILS